MFGYGYIVSMASSGVESHSCSVKSEDINCVVTQAGSVHRHSRRLCTLVVFRSQIKRAFS